MRHYGIRGNFYELNLQSEGGEENKFATVTSVRLNGATVVKARVSRYCKIEGPGTSMLY